MFRPTLLLSLGAIACAPRAAPRAQPESPASIEADTTVVQLERTPCFGRCPVYRVAISASGRVRFVGTRFVAHEGEASGQIAKGKLDSLLAELEREGYFDFADRYVSGSAACGAYATDAPSAITEVSHAGRHKRIEHDYGCSQAPPILGELEGRIDEVAETARWTRPQ